MQLDRSLTLLGPLGVILLGAGASGAVLTVPAAYPTIQSALNNSINGDTILVSPGVYREGIDFGGKLVELRSSHGAGATTIDGEYRSTVVSMGGASSLVGFTITGGSASFGAGLSVWGTGSIIRGNIFENNRQGSGGFGAAIGGNGASPLIEQNLFRNNTADTQYLSGVVSFVNSSSPKIINNVFENNQATAINLTLPAGNSPQIINNTIVGNRSGMRLQGYGLLEMHAYHNNIIANNEIGVFGMEVEPTVFTHNLLYGNTIPFSGVANLIGMNGNLSANPLFVAPSNYDLLANSPAIDAGRLAGAPLFDFDGRPRPMDGDGNGTFLVDIGAFEVPEPASLVWGTTLALLGLRRARR